MLSQSQLQTIKADLANASGVFATNLAAFLAAYKAVNPGVPVPSSVTIARLLEGDFDQLGAALMNLPVSNFTKTVTSIPITTLAQWAATGPRAKIEQAIASAQTPVAVAACCYTIRDMFQGLNGPALDMSSAANKQLIAAMVTAGVLSVTDQQNLSALTKVSPATYAESLLGDGVVMDHESYSWLR